MSTLTVWQFDDAGDAARARYQILELEKDGLISVHDAAVVSWPVGARRPTTGQEFSTTGSGGTKGAFWGLLFGLVFLVPLFGIAFGAAIGAIRGSMADLGIDDEFIAGIRERVVEGTSALFLLSSDAVVDRIRAVLDLSGAQLVSTDLSVEDEEALREAFAAE